MDGAAKDHNTNCSAASRKIFNSFVD